MTFLPSCSQMRLQLLHFHAVFKMWPTFQELTSTVSFRRRRWSQRNFSENRNIQGNQSKDVLSKIRGLRRTIFLASRRWRCRPRSFKVPNSYTYLDVSQYQCIARLVSYKMADYFLVLSVSS